MNFTESFLVPADEVVAEAPGGGSGGPAQTPAHPPPPQLWFDSSQQHVVYLRTDPSRAELSFHTWCPWRGGVEAGASSSDIPNEEEGGGDRGPRLIHKCPLPKERVEYAALSLDRQLLAIQFRSTSITVVELGSAGRTWVVDIKSPSSNEILRNGFVWSDHGGSSQDLVIITLKGIELYKISASRNQCKLSRYVALRSRAFWYEPNFRCILVADFPAVPAASAQKQQLLTMNGIILNCDKSDAFKIELPPPEKIPSFSLGPGIFADDVSLVSLYGKLYCTAYVPGAESSHVSLYEISKQGATKRINLLCNLTGPMTHSCFDNLLVCHFLDANKSVVFDVWDSKKSMIGSGTDLSAVDQLKQSTGCMPLMSPFQLQSTHPNSPLCNAFEPTDGTPPPELPLAEFEFWSASNLVYDKKSKLVYKLTCCLCAYEGSLASHAAFFSFLLRRGQAPSAPRPVSRPDAAIGAEAKKIVLSRLYTLFESKIPLDEALIVLLPIVQHYASAFTRYYNAVVHRDGDARLNDASKSVQVADKPGSGDIDSDSPLEQYVSFQLLKHDADVALTALSGGGGGNSSHRVSDTAASAPTSKFSTLISMSLTRSSDGWLIVTQIELLCFVWMPLLLHAQCDIKYIARLLTLYQAELRGSTNEKLNPEPIVSLLLFKLLVRARDEIEIARLMQTQFFSDSSELALECLSLADALTSSHRSQKSGPHDGRIEAIEQATRMLHQSAMDVLWRLGEIVSLTRRLLFEGRIFEAIELCSKQRGAWRTGLSPSTISSDLFYTSLDRYICKLRDCELPADEKAQRIVAAMTSVYEFLVDWDPSVLLLEADVSKSYVALSN